MATRYPLAMRVLHWTIALLIAGQLWAGWFMVRLDEETPARFDSFYPLHKSFGLLVLLLVVGRMLVRLSSSVPELPAGLSLWEKYGAKCGHAALYVLMLAVPVFGYSMSSSFTESDGVTFFGIEVPELLPKNDERFELFRQLHKFSGYLLLALVAVHAAAALKHRFFDRDRGNDVLSRML